MILRIIATVAFVCLALSNSVAYRAADTCPCSLFDASAVPAVEDTGADAPVTLGVKFVAEHDGQISAIRFYKSAANVGPHVGHIWSSSGALLGSVTFDSETASGWQEATFDSPIAVSGGQTYVASYRAPTGHYSFTGEFFVLLLHARSADGARRGDGVRQRRLHVRRHDADHVLPRGELLGGRRLCPGGDSVYRQLGHAVGRRDERLAADRRDLQPPGGAGLDRLRAAEARWWPRAVHGVLRCLVRCRGPERSERPCSAPPPIPPR